MSSPLPEHYSVAEAAELLGVTDARIRQMLLAGELSGERREGKWRIPARDAHDLLATRPRRQKREEEKGIGKLREHIGELQHALGEARGAEAALREEVEMRRTEQAEILDHLALARERVEVLHRELHQTKLRLERTSQAARRLQAQRERLRRQLEVARKPRWQRFFEGRARR
jgi:excisionase family DNA binding protein